MNKHIFILYGLTTLALIFALSNTDGVAPQSNNFDELFRKVEKVEFYQEATRVMNNLIGFDQVNTSLTNDEERVNHCSASQDLLKEWQEDVSALQNLNRNFVNSDDDAKNYLNSIETLYDEINSNCSKLTQ